MITHLQHIYILYGLQFAWVFETIWKVLIKSLLHLSDLIISFINKKENYITVFNS